MTFWGTARLFSKVVAPFSKVVSEGPSFSTSSLTLGIIWRLQFEQGPSGCSMGIRLRETEAEAGDPVRRDCTIPSGRVWWLDPECGQQRRKVINEGLCKDFDDGANGIYC